MAHRWEDIYDQFGSRTARKRVAEAAERARRCMHCAVKFHAQHNYKCRRHVGTRDGSHWPCCLAAAGEPGCRIAPAHEAEPEAG